MLELRRALIDEVETILKEFVVKYDREVRYVGGWGEGGELPIFLRSVRGGGQSCWGGSSG